MITIPATVALGLVVLWVIYLRFTEHRKIRASANSLIASHEHFDNLLDQLAELVGDKHQPSSPSKLDNVHVWRLIGNCKLHVDIATWMYRSLEDTNDQIPFPRVTALEKSLVSGWEMLRDDNAHVNYGKTAYYSKSDFPTPNYKPGKKAKALHKGYPANWRNSHTSRLTTV